MTPPLPGHRFAFDSLSRCLVCDDCGTAMHRNGRFWLRGKWSTIEPPCGGDGALEWYDAANPDPDDPFTSEQRERWCQTVTDRESGEGQAVTLTQYSHQLPAETE